MENARAGTPSRRGAAAPANPCRRKTAAPGWRTRPRPRAGCRWPRIRASRGGCVRISCRHFFADQLSVGRKMNAAFGRCLDFPPPAPGARILARDHGPRAGRAADRAVALVMERVVGHLEKADIAPDVVLGPLGERIEFCDAVPDVELLHLNFGAGGRLAAPQTGD